MEFFIVDVFTSTKYAGNQLAVFRQAGELTKKQMQAFARETNFAETTFILSDEARDGGFDVRIFTPAAEIPFAGHPSLGTAFIIREQILQTPVAVVNLNLKVGKIPVTFASTADGETDLWMQQVQPAFGETLAPALAAEILNFNEADLDERFPIQEVSTGLPFYFVPLKTLAAVRASSVNMAAYRKFVEKQNPDWTPVSSEVASSAFLLFTPETYNGENNLNCRMFDPLYNVPEDPATGSANGCLLAYLLHHDFFGRDELDLRVEQGYEIGRPALLKIRGAVSADGKYEINVGGQVQLVARGEWFL